MYARAILRNMKSTYLHMGHLLRILDVFTVRWESVWSWDLLHVLWATSAWALITLLSLTLTGDECKPYTKGKKMLASWNGKWNTIIVLKLDEADW